MFEKVTQRRVLDADALAAQKAEHFNLIAAARHSAALTAPQAALDAAGHRGSAAAAFALPGPRNEGMGEEDEPSGSGLGRQGWVGSGAYVTLHLAPREDFRRPAGAAGDDAAASVAATFAEDAAAFARLVAGHAGCASPVSLHALHRHENRLTMLHMHVQRASTLFLDEGEARERRKNSHSRGASRALAKPLENAAPGGLPSA